MSKRQLLLDAFNNLPVERVPVGFWFHFASDNEFFRGLEDPSVIKKNVEGHKKFYTKFNPDFVKIMSDGFFGYPNDILRNAKNAEELLTMKPLGAEHPWITAQVNLVKELSSEFGSDVLTFYNVFAPATFFKFLFGVGDGSGNKILADYILENKDAVKHALNVIAEDLAFLAKAVIQTGKADGIYLSVQNVQDERITNELYSEVVAPSELLVLNAANEASEYNILHICGYEGSRNDLNLYVDYNAKIINWAVNIENVSLEDGKKLFGGRAVIGGFANTAKDILYSGSKSEIEDFTDTIIKKAGKIGIVLGADCTVPSNIDLTRLDWVRNKAASL